MQTGTVEVNRQAIAVFKQPNDVSVDERMKQLVTNGERQGIQPAAFFVRPAGRSYQGVKSPADPVFVFFLSRPRATA